MTTETTEPTFTGQADLNYYELLQVSPQAETATIEAAYRKMALRYHPDHNSSHQATEMMQALNGAYATLKDPKRRNLYNLELAGVFAFSDDLSDEDYEPPVPYNQPLSVLRRFGWLSIPVLLGFFLFQVLNAFSQTDTLPTPNMTTSAVVNSTLPAATLPPGTLFFDDLEKGSLANWQPTSPWHLTTRYSHSGKYSLWFGDENLGHYRANLSAAVSLAQAVSLPTTNQPTLSFWLAGQTDRDQASNGEDRLFVEIAPVGQDFQTIFTANGLYQNWQEITLDLNKWRGRTVNVRFRFSSGTLNSGAGFSGFFLDDIKINN